MSAVILVVIVVVMLNVIPFVIIMALAMIPVVLLVHVFLVSTAPRILLRMIQSTPVLSGMRSLNGWAIRSTPSGCSRTT